MMVDYTLYFNKDTKLLERYEYLLYVGDYVLTDKYVATVSYDVADIEHKLDTTAYKIIQSSDDLIELEIIRDFNTENETRYSFAAPSNAEVCAFIDGYYYEFYSDPECTNPIITLDEYAGQEKLTLYTKKYEEPVQTRYTVTCCRNT